jgi:N-acetylmuramoyl-L-alanine amidase
LTPQRFRIWLVLLASLLALPTVSFSAVSPARRARAIAAYDHAVRMRTTLESQPENARRKADYLKLIRAFQEVYRLNPAYSKTPVALTAVAEIYEQMGRRLSDDNYYLESIKAYEFVATQYPQNRLARDALFTISEVYRVDLENLEAARQAYQKFLEQYPKSAQAADAQDRLKQIDQTLSERARNGPRSRSLSAQERRAETAPEVTAIRNWVGPNYSRIVIGVEGEVKFETQRLANPDRIVLDLPSTRLSPALAGKTFPVEDGYLRQIRVAQFKPGVTRVVLDVAKLEDYSIFSLPNPFRLVIDIHGAALAEKAPATPPKEPQEKPPQGSETLRAANKPPAPAPPVAAPAKREPARPEPVREAEASSRESKAKAASEAETSPAERAGGGKEPSEPPVILAPARKEPGASTASSSKGTSEGAAAPKPPVPTEPGARTLTRALGLKIGRIVIDPGHGGHDTGTIGPTGLREKDLVLDVALRLKKSLEGETGGEVILTRDDDTFIPLEERTAIANQKAADLFISIHANASRDRSARGIETYYLNFTSSADALEVAARENATSQESVHQLQDLIKKIALTEKIEESHAFAREVQREVHNRLVKASRDQKDRGVKKAPFVVLIGANMPSILAEISFLTNPRDERLLKKPEYRQRIAEALYQGVVRYMNTLGGVKVAQKSTPGDRSGEGSTQESPAADPPNF